MSIRRPRFTRATATSTPAPGRPGAPTKKTFSWDGALPGFGLCARPSGLKTWVVQYRTADARSRRITLGDVRSVSLDDARKKAREHLSRAHLGQDPQAVKTAARHAVRLRTLVDAYLVSTEARHSKRYRSEVERHLTKHALPLHHEAAAAISRSDIDELLRDVTFSSGPVAANRLRASLSALWTWSLRTGRIDGDNPVANVPRPAKERTRDRVLTDSELGAIWRGTGGGNDHDRIVRVLMLTGARREEVGSMRWSEIEPHRLEGGGGCLWTLPRERSKNGLPHEVFLGPACLAQLPPQRTDNDMVFGLTENGFSGWSRCKARLDKRLVEARARPWVLHDLRRTFSTWCNESGIEPHVVEALLNHVSGTARRGVAGVYNRAAYRTQKATALARWAKHIDSLADAAHVMGVRHAS